MPEWGKMDSEQAKVTESSDAAFKRPRGWFWHLSYKIQSIMGVGDAHEYNIYVIVKCVKICD